MKKLLFFLGFVLMIPSAYALELEAEAETVPGKVLEGVYCRTNPSEGALQF